MLTGFQRSDGLGGMIWYGRVDVNGVHIWVLEHVFVLLVAFFDTKGITDGIELLFVTLAYRVHAGVGMVLIDGNELSTKPQSNDGNIDFFPAHDIENSIRGFSPKSTTSKTQSAHKEARLLGKDEAK